MHRAAIISFFLLCACAQPTAAVDEEPLASAYRLQRFAIDPFEEPIGNSFSLADAKAKIIERFGEPIEQESSSFPDRTSDEIFTRFIFQYDGITFRVGENEAGNRSWIERTEVTGNTHALAWPAREDLPIISIAEFVSTSLDEFNVRGYVIVVVICPPRHMCIRMDGVDIASEPVTTGESDYLEQMLKLRDRGEIITLPIGVYRRFSLEVGREYLFSHRKGRGLVGVSAVN